MKLLLGEVVKLLLAARKCIQKRNKSSCHFVKNMQMALEICEIGM